ncbi:hypothetical protein C1N59_22370 (plasmid) [Pantoea sp. SGAir0183]
MAAPGTYAPPPPRAPAVKMRPPPRGPVMITISAPVTLAANRVEAHRSAARSEHRDEEAEFHPWPHRAPTHRRPLGHLPLKCARRRAGL